MTWNLQSDRPIYRQLVEQMQLRIVSGEYKPGDRLPSVRDLAAQAAVNPNTMQKALAELEQSGLVYTQRTSGRFITEDEQMLAQLKHELARHKILDFFADMQQLGIGKNEAISLMTQQTEEGTGE